jgi:YVTN family beta-propeller protein
MPSKKKTLPTFVAAFAMAGATVSSASPNGYVYVAVAASACAPAPCGAPQVVVVDAATAEIVTRIEMPAQTSPSGIAISPDGTRLYVSNAGASTSLTVIDARKHTVLRTVNVTHSGQLAVGSDPSRVFLLAGELLYAFDASTGQEIRSVAVSGLYLAASVPLNRVFVGGFYLPFTTITAYDADTFAELGRKGSISHEFRISRDGLRLFDIATNPSRPSNGFFGDVMDAATFASLAHYHPVSSASAPIDVSADELLMIGSYYLGTTDSSGSPVTAPYLSRFKLSGGGGSGKQFPNYSSLSGLTLPSPGNRVFAYAQARDATAATGLAVIDLDSFSVVKTFPFGGPRTTTPWGVLSCTYALNRTYVPLARTAPHATVNLTTDCPWSASTSESWIHLSQTAGSGNATLTFTLDPNQGGSPREGTAIVAGQVVRFKQASFAFEPPFGVMDTPADGAAVQGSIAVTGWALDDIGVQRVEIWRDLQPGEPTTPFSSTPSDPRHGKVFIANGTFVDGARPDIASLYPAAPLNARAGWGYLLLTWGLWNQGNGAYKLYAYAIDEESNITSIGSKTIVANNIAANKPFGAIDTPGIGGEASGPNFGWALTPNVTGAATCRIPASGVKVSIDSRPLEPVVYGGARSDVARSFQGFSNSETAGGHFIFDWSTLTNGSHTIGWLVTDDCGRAEGIGSRFFTVTTGTTVSSQTAQALTSAMRAGLDRDRESAEPVLVRQGHSQFDHEVSAESGVRVVDVRSGERMQIRLPHGYTEAHQVLSAGERRPLPIGSTWDAASGTFYWQPAPGFLGSFVIRFSNGLERVSVRVRIAP